MNYARIYDELIARARTRTIDGYSERHHVVPRCLGGDNSSQNIVRLTPEEHYLAHQLLVKMHPGNKKLVLACSFMTTDAARTKRNNKLYGWLRRRLATALTGRRLSEDTRQKIRARAIGRKASEETKQKMSASAKSADKTKLRSVQATPEFRQRMSEAKRGKPGRKHTEAAKQRMRDAASNRRIVIGADGKRRWQTIEVA
jgi:hypothetical protein